MSEDKPKAAEPQEEQEPQADQLPQAPSAQPPPSLEGKYHFCVVPDVSVAPRWLASDDLDTLMKEAYTALCEAGSGWAFFVIDGKRCLISNSQQVFHLKMPDGEMKLITGQATPVFSPEGRFTSMRMMPAWPL